MTNVTRQLVAASQGGKAPSEVCFDFTQLTFVEPAGLVFLSNLISWLRQVANRTVRFSGLQNPTQAICYLDDCGFFAEHNGSPIRGWAFPRSTTFPFTNMVREKAPGWLDLTFVPWLSSRTGKAESAFAPVRGCISELINNIADHSRYDIGGIAAQHFPAANRIQIAIADFGLGIPKSVAKAMQGLTDSDAIVKATEEGFTTQSTPKNRGAGLDYLLRVVPGNDVGTVSIYSGNGIVRFSPANGKKVEPRTFTSPGYCPGTLIELDISTDRIEIAEEEEDLQW